MAQQLDGQIQVANELVAIALTSGGTLQADVPRRLRNATVTVDHVVLALPFSTLRLVDTSKAGFGATKARAIRELGMGTNSKLHLQFKERFWADLGSTARRTPTAAIRAPGRSHAPRAAPRASSSTTPEGRSARASESGTPRRGRRSSSARSSRFCPARRHSGTARPRSTTGRVTNGPGARTRTGRSASTRRLPASKASAPELPLCGRAHLAGLAGLPQRRGRKRRAGRLRDPRRSEVAGRRPQDPFQLRPAASHASWALRTMPQTRARSSAGRSP